MGKKKLSALKCHLSHLTCGSLVALSKARPGVDRGGSNGKRKIPWRTRDKGERGGHPADPGGARKFICSGRCCELSGALLGEC